MERVTKPSESKGRIRFLERHETSALLEACKASNSPHSMASCCLRCRRVCGRARSSFRWHEVDLERESILLTDTKNGERRAVPFAGQALEMMRSNSQVRRLDTDLVFPGRFRPGQQASAPVSAPRGTKSSASWVLKTSVFDLRHTAAITWL